MTAMIEVENLSKRYRRGGQDRVYRTFREDLMGLMTRPFRRRRKKAADTFWALRDVSFQVNEGEVVGIIGKNGAGKSTLLKILSRITQPTEGRARLYGRVGSLLEVGTGFHPELTGNENIYLSGTILGMRRAEVRSRFDEIVAFAEIEDFLDTPVKHYSSGMYVRLAFAVAAHLDPEILLVDEVLAVGDMEFQKKCLGKMSEVAEGGRTVVLVSHNMNAIKRLCQRAIWLKDGKIGLQGTADECVTRYFGGGGQDAARKEFTPHLHLANKMPVALVAVQISDAEGRLKQTYSARECIQVQIEWILHERLYKPRIGFILYTTDGMPVLTSMDAGSWSEEWLEPGKYVSRCTIMGQLLNEGSYMLEFSGDVPRGFAFRHGLTGWLLRFHIRDDMTLPSRYYGQDGVNERPWPGPIMLNIPWNQERVDAFRRTNVSPSL